MGVEYAEQRVELLLNAKLQVPFAPMEVEEGRKRGEKIISQSNIEFL